MNTKRPVIDLIKNRISCRSYDGKAIEDAKKEKIEDFLEKNSNSPFGTKPRFTLFAAGKKDNDALKGLGTYGFIKGASGFIVGAIKNADYALEDYGYLMEKNVLYTTDIGLGSCWVGGSFKRSVFSQKAKTTAGEYVPAVIAIGNAASKRRWFDTALRLTAGSAKRKPFHEIFYASNFETPLIKENAGVFEVPLEMLRLAPSASNNQPWRVVWDQQKYMFHFYLERTKKYYERNKKFFGVADMQRIDMGIAMCHFELASEELGIKGEWVVKKPDVYNPPKTVNYLVSRKIA